jgi:hypothetical protein
MQIDAFEARVLDRISELVKENQKINHLRLTPEKPLEGCVRNALNQKKNLV